MAQDPIQKTRNGIFQVGSRFPEIAGSAICNVGEDRLLELEVESLSKKVLDYLKKHKKAYISDLSEKLGVSPLKVVLAIKKLENEGLVK